MSRLNLQLLRNLTSPGRANGTAAPGLISGHISRRSFLALSSASIAYGATPPLLRGAGFSLVREDGCLHLVVNNEPRWTIDPTDFGKSARIAVSQVEGEIVIHLRNAMFAGTNLSADFDCNLARQFGKWSMRLAMTCGIEVSAELLDWLDGRVPAVGSWAASRCSPFQGFDILFKSSPVVQFSPDWKYTVIGPVIVALRNLEKTLPSSAFQLVVNAEETLAGVAPDGSTTINIHRQDEAWRINLARQSAQGWSLQQNANEDVFDELSVEAALTNGQVLRTAMLRQGVSNAAVVTFFPGDSLCTDCGDPFTLPLRSTRLAFGLEEKSPVALVSELNHEPIWAHGAEASYLLAALPETPLFELHEGPDASPAPQITPGLCEVCFPGDDSCLTLKMGVPRPVPFTWGDVFAPFEQFWGWLHLLPSQHGKGLLIDLQRGDALLVERPRDMVSLKFQFENMRLITGIRPRIVHIKGAGDPRIIVKFPPQHVAEEAYFHTQVSGFGGPPPVGLVELAEYNNTNLSSPISLPQLQAIMDPDSQNPTDEPDKPKPPVTIAGESQLVFGLPPHEWEVACETGALLDWSKWQPIVAPCAKTLTLTQISQIPPIVDPTDPKGTQYTSIEMPWHLNLSPSEKGRWAHAVEPVESREKVVELWHTRLGVQPQPGSAASDSKQKADKKEEPCPDVVESPSSGKAMPVDEANQKDRTVRAIWTYKFYPPQPTELSCSTLPPDHTWPQLPEHFPTDQNPDTDPFRMTLDARDRTELVHLMSNYAVTKQANFCDQSQAFPSDPAKLLPPAPADVGLMVLTAMGGYLDVLGEWNPGKIDQNHQLTVQLWAHSATLGRDHYVKVMYKGYLMPFGLSASLVKLTQREFKLTSAGNYVAILHQYIYIVVKNQGKSCPIAGQPFGGRDFPFNLVEPVTLQTPYLDSPDQPWNVNNPHGPSQNQSLFWPMVQGQAFPFRIRFTDTSSNHTVESSMPLVFVGSDVAQQDGFAAPGQQWKSQDAVRLYNGGYAAWSGTARKLDDPWLNALFNGSPISFAKSSVPGDTDFDTQSINWRAAALMAQVKVVLAGASGSFTITFIETNSGIAFTDNLGSTTSGSVSVNSGIYTVTVTSTIGGKTQSVTSPAFSFSGNYQYTLNLSLKPDGSGFSATPAQPAGMPNGMSPTDLYRGDLPYFYPATDTANITSASIKRITGVTTPTRFVFYSGYLASGFNKSSNPGEVLLQKHPSETLTLSFGASGQVDKAGGLASPDALVVGLSRQAGVIGGKMANAVANGAGQSLPSLDTYSGGKFDPADFFGGLSSAKLLGAVKLSDIISAIAPGIVSNLGKAPLMLQQAVYSSATITLKLAEDISDFQKVQGNPLATHLSGQAQQVAVAAANLQDVLNSDPITTGIAEAQLVSRIIDYAGALKSAVQDPASLIEQEIIDLLSQAVSSVLTNATATIVSTLTTISAQFTQTLENLLISEDPAANTLDSALNQLATLLKNTLQQDDLTQIKQPLSVLAPEVNHLVSVEEQVAALKNNIQQLGASFSQAAAAIQQTPPSAQQLPGIVSNLNTVITSLSQVYEKAGLLVGVGVDLKTPGTTLMGTLTSLKTTMLAFWKQLYSGPAPDLTTLENNCVILAAAWDPTTGQQILQSLRQLQKSVDQAVALAAQVLTPSPTSTQLMNDYRQLQMLQKLQGQILRALAELQTLANKKPLPAISTPTATLATQNAVAAIIAALPLLANTLTVAPNLISQTMDQMIATLVADSQLIGPLTAPCNDLQVQLAALRSQMNQNPVDLSLLLLYYNISIDYQRPFQAALSYAIYLQNAGLEAQSSVVSKIETLTSQVGTVLCTLKNVWSSFRAQLDSLNGPDILGAGQLSLGSVIDSMFVADLNAIDQTFANICDAAQASPSQMLRNAQAVAAAFTALEADVRARITNVPAILNALTDALKQQAQQLLENLLDQLPIPTSINLSYNWTPDIQSCEPVFIVDPGATFTVTATAQAGLNSQLNGLQASFDVEATLTQFEICLIGDTPFITLVFDKLTFTSQNGSKVDCRATLNHVTFGDPMTFVQQLADILDPSDGPFIELDATSIRAGFRFSISSLTMGAFNLMQLAIEVAVALPFDGTPVRCEFNLSDQQQPFLLSSGIFGGGGFLQLQLGLDGVQLLQGAFEFGVCADISIGPLSGSGFVVAGIYFRVTGTSSEVCGFVHAHGHMDIFGIISMDVDLYVAVCYLGGQVQGTATFSVSISIAFFSETFTMQAHYGFQGSTTSAMLYGTPYSTEAFLVLPGGTLSDTASDAVVPKQYCNDQTPQFIDPNVWAKYYNSFV